MLRPIRTPKRTITLAVGAVLLAAGAHALTATPALAATATGGSGASLPYVEVQAESSATNGTIIGPSYTQGQLADEASCRKAVTLQGTGKYVTFTTPVPTNSINFRYSIPDSTGGSIYTAPLSLYINGAKQPNVTLTNAYSWFYGSYPFTNSPGSNPHHFFDEVHRLFATTYPAGTTFTLQVDAEDTASSYTIDFADFEQVGAALTEPAGAVSVTSKGADASGVNDSTGAFNAAISAAGAGGTVWIPPGTYNVPGHIGVNNVTIAGAGQWYSTITGAAPGFYGNSAPSPSTNVRLQSFAIFGNVQERNDGAQVNAVGGAMSNSTVSDLWIEHLKVGAWMDGPMNGLTLSRLRIRDTTADGINFHGAVTNSTVTNSDIRNTGDDGIATWAEASIGADAGDTISNNTVQLQQLANGIAIYGGHDNTVTGNLVQDSGITNGGGIHVGQRFNSTPVGTTTISDNTLVRDGSLDPNWQFGVGSLWFDATQGAITGPINVTNVLIQQSPYEAIQWVEGTISGVNLDTVTISGAGTFALQMQTGGSASAANVVATGVAQNPPSYSCEGGNFTLVDKGGDSGIAPTQCNGFPPPVYPPYPPSGVTATPSALNFGSVATGSSSAPQTVTVTNSGTTSATVSGVAVTGDFSQINNCSTIAVGASCTVSVAFRPTAAGARTGTLTISSDANNSPTTVSLSGTGVDSTTNLAAAKPASASSSNGPYVASNITDADPSTYWESVNGSFPQWAQVDLGQNYSIGQFVLKLPPSTAWGARTETLSLLGSTDGTSFSTIVGSAGYVFDPNANNNTVTITFNATTARYVRVNITANTGWNAGQLSDVAVFPSGGAGAGSTNLAAGKATSESSHTDVYPSSNVADGNQGTYWESANNALPQWVQVDLGSAQSAGRVVLQLPASWGARNQTLSLLGSTDGSTFSTIKPSATYTFDPTTSNTVTITFTATTQRYFRVNITANTGWPAGQVSELQVWNK